MQRVEVTAAEADVLIDRLIGVKPMEDAPREERAWIVSHGELRRYDRDEIVVHKTDVVTELLVLLSGRIVVYFDHGTGRRHLMESRSGSVTGLLPYSRLVHPQGDAVAEEPCDVIVIQREDLPELTRQCPTITAALVHLMLDRARRFSATDWQDEKMVSLGRLAAGIAHELNNPASAATRAAKLLEAAVLEVGEAAGEFGATGLPREQRALVESMIRRRQERPGEGVLSPLERAEREDAIAERLLSLGTQARYAASFAAWGVTIDDVCELAAALPPTTLDIALRWWAATCAAQLLVSDVDRSTARMNDLVVAVKRFTFMDRAGVPVPTDIAQGLIDTIALLAAKARQKSVAVRLDIAPDLPLVLASVTDLNQVWSNLIENAIDAVGESGEVNVRAAAAGDAVVVRVIDNGPGVPESVQAHIFDPFFTTKPVGEGIGLGLDLARRIVRANDGQIELETVPGKTEFRIRLPAHRESAASQGQA